MYQIYQVPQGAAQQTEPLGTKYKFWFMSPEHGLTLFKEGRPGTGENWAEKIAHELAGLIQMPRARYEFAEYEDRQGVISVALVNKTARVVHGNELLANAITDYEGGYGAYYANSSHTLRRVMAYFRGSAHVVGAPYGADQTLGIRSALDFFVGYLMFDAWIANQDRHDENWAILRMNDTNLFLAPSYDHGSSMARNEPDERRARRLTTKDRGLHITSFITKARSGFFPTTTDSNPIALHTLEAFSQAAMFSPNAAQEWMERLADVRQTQVDAIIDAVPCSLMSATARDFTRELLRLNRGRILNLRKK